MERPLPVVHIGKRSKRDQKVYKNGIGQFSHTLLTLTLVISQSDMRVTSKNIKNGVCQNWWFPCKSPSWLGIVGGYPLWIIPKHVAGHRVALKIPLKSGKMEPILISQKGSVPIWIWCLLWTGESPKHWRVLLAVGIACYWSMPGMSPKILASLFLTMLLSDELTLFSW